MEATLSRPTATSEKMDAANTPEGKYQETAAYPGVTVVPANEGTVLNAFGDAMLVKLGKDQTNNALEIFVGTVPPGSGPPPHIHHHEDEIFLLIEGQVRFLSNDQWTAPYGPGTLVYAPRGSRHSFQNTGNTPSRHWIITTGGGFGQFFAQCADVFAQPMPPDMGRIVEISTTHGIEYVPALPTAPLPSA